MRGRAYKISLSSMSSALQRGEPPGFSIRRARFQSPSPLHGDFLRLLWPLLTPAQTPCMLPHRTLSILRLPVEQASPDKNVICRYATVAFTVSPKPGVLSCAADLPGDSALYAISVRRLIVLRSSFLQTIPHGIALAFG